MVALGKSAGAMTDQKTRSNRIRSRLHDDGRNERVSLVLWAPGVENGADVGLHRDFVCRGRADSFLNLSPPPLLSFFCANSSGGEF